MSCNIENHHPLNLLLIHTLSSKDLDVPLEPNIIDDVYPKHSNNKSLGAMFLLTQPIHKMNILIKGGWPRKIPTNKSFYSPDKNTIPKQMISRL